MSEQNTCPQSTGKSCLEKSLPSLLLISIALFLTLLFAARLFLFLRTAFFFYYLQMPPAFLIFLAAILTRIDKKTRFFSLTGGNFFSASFCLLALSPFATWALRSSEFNFYFAICNLASLGAFFWWQLELYQYFRTFFPTAKKSLPLLLISRAEFFVLWFEIVPLAALYFSGILGLSLEILLPSQLFYSVWKNFGNISITVRILLFCGLLQSFCLSLYLLYLANLAINRMANGSVDSGSAL